MSYHIVLYDLENGVDKAESIPLDNEPPEYLVEQSARFYGAKRYEIIEKENDAEN